MAMAIFANPFCDYSNAVGQQGKAFDSPFVRGWVITHALPDMGLALLPTHIASETSEYQSPKAK